MTEPREEGAPPPHVLAARAQIGLAHDAETVRATARMQDSVWRPGFGWLTPEECALVDVKLATSADGPLIAGLLRSDQRACFAGLEFDWLPPEGAWWIGFTDQAVTHVRDLGERYGHPARLRSFKARYTLAELESIRDRVQAALPVRRRGRAKYAPMHALPWNPDLCHASVRVRSNDVLLTVPWFDADVAGRVKDEFGPVEVQVGPRVGNLT